MEVYELTNRILLLGLVVSASVLVTLLVEWAIEAYRRSKKEADERKETEKENARLDAMFEAWTGFVIKKKGR